MEYYSAIKKNKIMPFAATWMDLEIFILSEVSQTEKDKYHMIRLICGKKRLQMKLSISHYRVLSRVPWAIQWVRISYLFYIS